LTVSAATLEQRPRLPAEHLGQARLLRQRLAVAEQVAHEVYDRVWQLVQQRHRTRGSVLAEAARLWQQKMPACGSLSRTVQLTKHGLDITEARLCGDAEFRLKQWSDDGREPSIALTKLFLTCGRKRSYIHATKVAHLGLHCVSRWHERSRPNDDAAFYAACLPIVQVHSELLEHLTDDFKIATVGGHWLGHMARLETATSKADDVIVAVRTFVAA
jgi:hypothetical protein